MIELARTFFAGISNFFNLQYPGLPFTFFQVFIVLLILKVCLQAVYIILGVSLDSTVDKPEKKTTR